MNRNAIYDEWRKKDYTDSALCDEGTIKRFQLVSDHNFEFYVSYQNHLVHKGTKIREIKNRRSKILSLLVYLSNNNLDDITQDLVDDYFEQNNTEKPSTNHTRVDYLKSFLKYHSLEHTVNLDKHRMAIDRNTKKMSRISAKQISYAREKYKNNPWKHFVFEMMYYTSLSMAEIGKFKIENFHPSNSTITYENKKCTIPKSLFDLIQTMHITGEFEKNHDIASTIAQMRKELREYGMENLTATDGKETRKTTFWKCPQCGYEYEAVADNWCVKQYTENGDNWVVCRERCSNE